MQTPVRLSLYGLGLIAVFGAAFLVADAVVPDDAIDARETAIVEDHGPRDDDAPAEGAPREDAPAPHVEDAEDERRDEPHGD